jgi:uncharacterized membrane protein (UPF0182 family)
MDRFGTRDYDWRRPPPQRSRASLSTWWTGIILLVLTVLIVGGTLRSLFVDWLWFDSVFYGQVYLRMILPRVTLFLIGLAIAVAVIGLNVWLAYRFAPRGFEESFVEDVTPETLRRIGLIIIIAISLFMGVVFAAIAGGAWDTLLLWQNGVSFGITDPAFNRDVSFYLFRLPAWKLLHGWVIGLLIAAALMAAAVYGLHFAMQRFMLVLTPTIRIHASVLAGLLFLLIAAGTWLGTFDLVTSPNGIVYGATYTDLNARLPLRYVTMALAVLAGVVAIGSALLARSFRPVIIATALWLIVSIAGAFYPALVQSLFVAPNELERESRYIAYNIEMTRRAFGLDRVEQLPFPAEPAVSREALTSHPETVQNIRLWDPRTLLTTYSQLQSIRPLYTFLDIDIDRYILTDRQRQVMLSARELDIARAENVNWTRERLQLTHGFGGVVSPVNEVLPEGLPVLWTRGIPPQSDILPISEDGARIYFGERTNHYVIVKTRVEEFDYPVGESNVTTVFEPDRGIRLASVFHRFMLAWHLSDLNILISQQIHSDSRVLMHRNIQQRIAKVAPFLRLDPDPYLVVHQGRLYWIQDAYTTASRFPYSQPVQGINYIRNSVKVLVDAETGDITFFLIDPNDPVAATWGRIFPDLFTPASEMPSWISGHLRYPEEMFKIQADRFLRYHVQDPRVFFIGEDFWTVPARRSQAGAEPLEPYYVTLRLPGESQEEFAIILPFTPRNRQNTIAWLAGRSDGAQYGQLRAYRFPSDDLVFGPAQIEARIDQDPTISQQIALWSQSGSEVIRGNLLMIPIGNSFLFVEPIYLQARDSRLPELTRIIAATGNRIAMEPTLVEAIDVIFGTRGATPPQTSTGTGTVPPTTQPPTSGQIPREELQRLLDETLRDLDRLRSRIEEIERLLEQ